MVIWYDELNIVLSKTQYIWDKIKGDVYNGRKRIHSNAKRRKDRIRTLSKRSTWNS